VAETAASRGRAGDAPAAAPLRIAWFGHGEGRRADGLSTYSRETVAALRARGAQVQTFAHSADGEGSDTMLRGVRLKTLTLSERGAKARVAAELDQLRPDLVHTSWSFSQLDGAIGRLAHVRGAPAVATFHLPYAAPNSTRGRVLQSLYRYHVRNLRHYDRCVALSGDQAALLAAAGYPRHRVTVIANGVDTAAIRPGPSSLGEELGARFIVAYMGRLDREKRVPALVRCFLDLGWPGDHVLVIAGGGTQEHQVRRLAAKAPGRVRLLGVVTDAARRLELLRAADVFVLPSTAEGLALSLLEAMAAGCAVVATDAGDDGLALGDAGVCIGVHPLAPRLREALQLLREDPQRRAELGARARQRVVERYSLQASVDALLGVYADLRDGAPVAMGAA